MTSTPAAPKVTRIVTREVTPGHEPQFEAGVRDMFARMQRHTGFVGATLVPPTEPGGCYQVVVNFASEEALAAWDDSQDRHLSLAQLAPHADNEPEFRRLSGLEAWFTSAVVPASMHPPKHRMALVTWMGIWPVASLFIWGLRPLWDRVKPQFLLQTAITTILITLAMTYLVMPRLTKLMRPFLSKRP